MDRRPLRLLLFLGLFIAMSLGFALVPFSSIGGVQAADQIRINSPAPDFSLPDLQGKEISLSSLKDKVVLLTFWSIWCHPCREEMPMMESLYKKYREKGLEVVGVNIDRESVESIRDFLKKNQLSFPVVQDREKKAMKAYSAHFMPTAFVIGHGGIVADKKVGIYNWMSPESQKFIEGLLKKK